VALEKTSFNLFVDLARGGEELDQPVAAAGREEGAASERVCDPVKSLEKKKPKKKLMWDPNLIFFGSHILKTLRDGLLFSSQ
jgi:hypothetical protein